MLTSFPIFTISSRLIEIILETITVELTLPAIENVRNNETGARAVWNIVHPLAKRHFEKVSKN